MSSISHLEFGARRFPVHRGSGETVGNRRGQACVGWFVNGSALRGASTACPGQQLNPRASLTEKTGVAQRDPHHRRYRVNYVLLGHQ